MPPSPPLRTTRESFPLTWLFRIQADQSWHVLFLPGSVTIYGQDWCYDGGEGYYRLGYVYREHRSDPDLHGRIYKAKGKVPDLPGICAEEIAALEERYPFFRERR